MLRRWCVPLATLAVLAGGLAATAAPATAAAGPRAPGAMAAHVVHPVAHLIRPGAVAGTRPMTGHGSVFNATTSTNWSGYAATGSFHSVSASWTEPTGVCNSSGKQFSSFWVGLDGFNSSTVEQTGSEVDCARRSPSYFAWFEMFPAAPTNFSDTVRPGDHFSASVTFNGGSSYTLVISDSTQGWSHTVNASLAGAANSSAEVIAEAPSSVTGVLPLADFGTVNFTNSTANGSSLSNFAPTGINMDNSSGQLKDQVSSLSGGNFSATWLRSN
jgi:peptidase A4-like protein